MKRRFGYIAKVKMHILRSETVVKTVLLVPV